MTGGQDDEPQEEDHCVQQEGFFATNSIADKPGETCRNQMPENPAAGWNMATSIIQPCDMFHSRDRDNNNKVHANN